MADSRVGIDTTFLVAHTICEHPDHQTAVAWKIRLLDAGRGIGICETILAEFIHVVTDPRRFEKPASMEEAVQLARRWLFSRETTLVSPTSESIALAFDWLERFRLGRKRILDTAIAATYHNSGIKTILTTNARDFHAFNCFEVIDLSRETSGNQ